MVALQTAEESGQLSSLMHHTMENLHPSLQMRLESPIHACRYIEFENTYKIDNDKMNFKDKDKGLLF
jgi:hypothetical protein